MSITSGFFNSVNGDRKYNAREMSTYFKGLISDGIYENVGDKFEVSAGEGMTVNVGSGRALIDCQWVENDAAETLNITPCPVGKRRWDAIVLRLDMSEKARNISLIVKEGTPVATGEPTPPARTWTETVKELHIYKILISSSITQMSNAMFASYRGTSYCPYVSGLIKQVSVEEFFKQYNAELEKQYKAIKTQLDDFYIEQKKRFDEWASTLTKQLNVNTDITKYISYNVYKPTGGLLESIQMPISQYESSDIVFLHIGGVMLIDQTDFSISGNGSDAVISFKRGITDNGDGVPISVLVLKSKSGGNVVLLDHAPTAADLTGTDCAIVQYNPSSSAVVSGDTTSIFNSVAVFVEKLK